MTLTADRQDLSITDGSADLHGVRILDGDEEVLTATRMEARISLRGLYAGRTIVERLVLDHPVVHARLEPDGRTNIGKILERPRTGLRAVIRPATLWEEILVHGGTVECDDRARGVRFRIFDIEASILEVQTGSGAPLDRFGQISVDANLEQPGRKPAPLAIVHWTTLSGVPEPTFVAHLALTGIDLDSFPAYVDASQRSILGVDHLDLVVSMDVREGIIRRGAAVATSPERTRALTLLFGGPFDAPVLDRSSQLLALWELPFSRLGGVGDVAWETGSAVVGGAVGVIEGLGRGDLGAAGGSAAEGVRGGVWALASNALDAVEGLGRALGLVAEEKARDPAAIHAHQRAQFLAARRKAAEEWSRAHPDRAGEIAATATNETRSGDHDPRAVPSRSGPSGKAPVER